MTIQAGVGVSTNRNPKAAGKEAARKALDAAELERLDFVFMFATVGYPQKDILNAVRQATAQAPLCGCSGNDIVSRSGSQKPRLIFQFDCVGRGKVILQESMRNKFLNNIQQQVGPETPWIGFYTLGEIGPVGNHIGFMSGTAAGTQ